MARRGNGEHQIFGKGTNGGDIGNVGQWRGGKATRAKRKTQQLNQGDGGKDGI
jgi:hypothetical protein